MGWGGRVELGLPLQVERTGRLWGAERCLRPQLWLRVTPAPAAGTYGLVHLGLGNAEKPGALMEKHRCPQGWGNVGPCGESCGRVGGSLEAQTFLTLSSSPRPAE